jgi:hypothetical protein
MADNVTQTNVIDRPTSQKSEQAGGPAERSEGGSSEIRKEEAQASSSGQHATPGRRPLFRR